MSKAVYLADTQLQISEDNVKGEFVAIGDRQYYRIANVHRMAPFFMTLVSPFDHWMFISSNGSLTCGRKNPDNALFPYVTDDAIHRSVDFTGSKTLVSLNAKDRRVLWFPFSPHFTDFYSIERNLYKSTLGNELIFEEVNSTLKLAFRYSWFFSENFGFVKRSTLRNLGEESKSVEIVDGIQNILPPGIERSMINNYSTLVEAYKQSELIEPGIALFTLSSVPTDRAEPSEALLATSVFSIGTESQTILLSSDQLENFCRGQEIVQENGLRARNGAFFSHQNVRLEDRGFKEWYTVAEINQDATRIVSLANLLKSGENLPELLEREREKGAERLRKIVAAADGIQQTNDKAIASRHMANTLFNVMRGGTFINDYLIHKHDFIAYLKRRNTILFNFFENEIRRLPETFTLDFLLSMARGMGNDDLIRTCYDYLPLYFGRRHGDPSRPWNLFSIDIKNSDGSEKLAYQGNWRDVFQNWEALALSYPGFIENMIAKFVNAVTADGYNPYRIFKEGFEWEVLDPDDPWSNIGYWGDHQVIYLLRLLELSVDFRPGNLDKFLTTEIFSYANIPYRIKPFRDIYDNPRDTIEFDARLDNQIKNRVEQIGEDAKLVWDKEGVLLVNLAEKLLVILAAKLVNFIPGAGIWMNTQRPEWNDANNALVGYGVSMVTLFYLRRYLVFLHKLFERGDATMISLSREVVTHLRSLSDILKRWQNIDDTDDRSRYKMVAELGESGTQYRQSIYRNGFSGDREKMPLQEILQLLDNALVHIDRTISSNKRSDGLVHSYNLLDLRSQGRIGVMRLQEMLEGQVAALSSGYLSAAESLALLEALWDSKLYRADQNSFMLYPDKKLPGFLQKNNIPQELISRSRLLRTLLEEDNSEIVVKDENGGCHFAAFRNAQQLQDALFHLDSSYQELVADEKELVLDIYEKVFDHHKFTGRSGTFFKYEGLGSIYWHMVSKLVLAVQEVAIEARKQGAEPSLIDLLKDHYHRIKEGLGVHKSPQQYGAFPTDPYSHTPAHAGAQQPGLTGQVKEDFIARMREIGVHIRDGKISFDPFLLSPHEFMPDDIPNNKEENTSGPRDDSNGGTLSFTLFATPVTYHIADRNSITITYTDGTAKKTAGLQLDTETSRHLFAREDVVAAVDVFFIKD